MEDKQWKVACDVDSVVADLYAEWFRQYNRDYDDDLTPSRCTSWDTSRFVKPECGDKIFRYLEDPTLYDNVEPIHGALEAINEIRDSGYRVFFVTMTSHNQAGAKLKWLVKHGFLKFDAFFGLNSSDYIETVDKSLVRADVIIDDYHRNLQSFQGHKILFDQPWNRDYNILFPTAMNWLHVLPLLDLFKSRSEKGS